MWHACPADCSSAWCGSETQQRRQHLQIQGLPRRFLRYIEAMFEVLVYVYENYWRGDACPQLPQLERKLNAIGFDADEIRDALLWLDGLNLAAQSTLWLDTPPSDNRPAPTLSSFPATDSMRVYSVAEQNHLGAECLGFISFLESAGVLPPPMREVILDRAMAVPGEPMALDDLKIIILMVYWSFGEEPDTLVLDELYDDSAERIAH